ncbi:hypothetical protein [Paenibacillus xylanexedens]|uniref:hypothetical protein n=1 Tax=Paenibacillus xylanexedens TaxID=528191 RepID=UPI003CFEE87E
MIPLNRQHDHANSTDEVMKKAVRRLLEYDGSTTYLLQDLLNCRLDIRVSHQRQITQSEVKPEILKLIMPNENDIYIERYSNLITIEHVAVSSNYVLFKTDLESVYLIEKLSRDSYPIGRVLEQESMSHVREPIGYGQAITDAFGEESICFYKNYLIRLRNNSCLYIHEEFHPMVFDREENHNADI